MRDMTRHAVRLLEQAQSGGDTRAVLDRAEAFLREDTGDLADGPACLHFARSVCFLVLGDPVGERDALTLMLHAAERENSPGWRACALATQSWHRLRLSATDDAGYDLDELLRALTTAEMLVEDVTDAIAAVNARVAIAGAYIELRLYELVEPHFQAAYRLSAAAREQNGNRAMWRLNLAELHLNWALELYMVDQVSAAEGHTAEAERHALRAAVEADGADAETWREEALLVAACSRADRHDPAGAAVDIEHHLIAVKARGGTSPTIAFSRPFHAVALRRSGRADEALQVMEDAIAHLTPDTGWLITAATRRTHAVLLAGRGSVEARAGLDYGDTMATALWRQRGRTLHAAATMKDLETLRVRHEQAARAADLDALTGIANRRAFDTAIERAQAGAGEVTVLLIDTDKFKQINDTRGHAAGDSALRAISCALAAQVRDQDLIARLGGDEFGALLPGVGLEAAVEIAHRMVAAVRDIPDCPATVSIGVATGPGHQLPETVCRADGAMYRVKRAGGDSVSLAALAPAAF